MSIEAMKQALEALEKLEKHNRGVKITTIKTGEVIHPAQIAQEAITSLRTAIAEAEKHEVSQEPVAWVLVAHKHLEMTPELSWSKDYNPSIHGGSIPLYTHPPKNESCPYVVSTKEGTHYCSLSMREPQYDKTEMNAFVQNVYDQKMREGKHGHYETMFHVVHKAIEQAHGIKGEA